MSTGIAWCDETVAAAMRTEWTDDLIARNLAKQYQPEPVARWELPSGIETDDIRDDFSRTEPSR